MSNTPITDAVFAILCEQYPEFAMSQSRAIKIMLDNSGKLERENARLRAGLESIAKNTCCERCQEAAMVARAALKPDA